MKIKDFVPEFDDLTMEAMCLRATIPLAFLFFTLWLLCAGAGLLKPPKRIRKWPYFAPGDY